MSVLDILSDDERLVVRNVREFVDSDVRPVVQKLEHADTCPENLVERMKDSPSTAWPSRRSTAATRFPHRASSSSPRNSRAAG